MQVSGEADAADGYGLILVFFFYSCALGYVLANCSACAVGFQRSGNVLAASGLRACSYDVSSGALAYVSLEFTNLFSAGVAGSTGRAAFFVSLASDLASALGVSSSRISVSSLDLDNKVVSVAILPGTPVTAPPSVASLVSQLQARATCHRAALYAGNVRPPHVLTDTAQHSRLPALWWRRYKRGGPGHGVAAIVSALSIAAPGSSASRFALQDAFSALGCFNERRHYASTFAL